MLNTLLKKIWEKTSIRVRIAPSPTGPLHIGTTRSALFNYVFAKQGRGKFVLRIEDTDRERSNRIFEEDIKNGLLWLGLEWDEFYRQSERSEIYRKYIALLLEKGDAFWCPHTKKELAEERTKQTDEKKAPRHICSFREKILSENKKKTSIIRFKNNTGGKIIFDDAVREEVQFDPALLGDFPIAKGLDVPLYNFAAVVDDYEMKITHIIRGEDHISNTPKQILLQKALGFEDSAVYAHLPLILGKDKSKLSKREGATSLLEYKKAGYIKEAMLNFLALLGWHPEKDREVLGFEEVINEFSLGRVQKGGAVFDTDKLNWLNREHIKKLETKDFARRLAEFLPEKYEQKIKRDPEFWNKISVLKKERMTKLTEAGDELDHFFETPRYKKELLFWRKEKNPEIVLRHLGNIKEIMSNTNEWSAKHLEEIIMPYADKEGRGNVLWPLRASLTGKEASSGPFDVADILGKKESIKRIDLAIGLMKNV